jgi:hypothetical protein
MKKTWKPVFVGILNLIAGIFMIAACAYIAAAMAAWTSYSGTFSREFIILVLVIAASILAAISGFFSLRRRYRGLVFGGSIGVAILGLAIYPGGYLWELISPNDRIEILLPLILWAAALLAMGISDTVLILRSKPEFN